jgi:hypothetical protein
MNKPEINNEQSIYRQSNNIVNVHGCMRYKCFHCGKSFSVFLEIGVEDDGRNGRPRQPCPMFIACECGEMMQDISGYLPLPSIREVLPNMKYFA